MGMIRAGLRKLNVAHNLLRWLPFSLLKLVGPCKTWSKSSYGQILSSCLTCVRTKRIFMEAGLPGSEPYFTIRTFIVLRRSLTSSTSHEVFNMDLARASTTAHIANIGRWQTLPRHPSVKEPRSLATSLRQLATGVRTIAVASTSPRRQSTSSLQTVNQRNRWNILRICSFDNALLRQAHSIRTSSPSSSRCPVAV
jgi:hypothetical protein